MPDHLYRGVLNDGNPVVTMDGQPLQALRSLALAKGRRDAVLFSESPLLDWGKGGPNALSLALAILTHETSPDEAGRRFRNFSNRVISQLPLYTWELTSAAVLGWLQMDREDHPLR
jgi:hypothetical protein